MNIRSGDRGEWDTGGTKTTGVQARPLRDYFDHRLEFVKD